MPHLMNEFLHGATRFPSNTALVLDDQRYTYQDLFSVSQRFSEAILSQTDHPFVGVYAAHSLEAYAGILGALGADRAYVPLNPRFPVERTASMINRAELDVIIVDQASAAHVNEIKPHLLKPVTWLHMHDLESESDWVRVPDEPTDATLDRVALKDDTDPNRLAYLMFTSGSTGTPKGVQISHGNIVAFLKNAREFAVYSEEDKFSQAFDLTFDLSLFDMFVCWRHGASLHVLSSEQRILPAFFIRSHQLTVWFSVPSAASLLHARRLLRGNDFPSLRVSLFCGEALSIDLARQWQLSAPNSEVLNLYGPTELTVACTEYRWPKDGEEPDAENGVVPIGHAFPGLEAGAVDDANTFVAPGQVGELVVRGPQTSPGYFKDEALTREKFLSSIDGEPGPWYKTGDRVRMVEQVGFHYLGRVDDQVKVQGFRVELGEIEQCVRQASASPLSAAVAWPLDDSSATRIHVFIAGSSASKDEILTACKQQLAFYMQPSSIEFMDALPLNANGKVDKRQLAELCSAKENKR